MFTVSARRRRLGAVILASALLSAGGTALAPSATAASDTCSTIRGTSQNVQTCFGTPQNTNQGWVVGYRDSIKNNLSSPVTGTCTASTSTTVTYSVSVTVTAEASAWIFAKVSGSVSGGVSRSMNSGYSTSATFTVPAKGTVNCHRGIVTQNFRTLRTTTTQQLLGGKVINTTRSQSWATGKAPASAQWRIFA